MVGNLAHELDFSKEIHRINQRRFTVKLTLKQFELFEFMIDRMQGDLDNGCEGVDEYRAQVKQLFRKMVNGKLLSR